MAEPKTFRAVHKWARIAPRKARLMVDLVRGLPYEHAKAVLENHPRRAATFLLKVLKSAMANASHDPEVDLRRLVVREARVDGGPLLGGRARWRPRAMGRATPINKRTSHLHIGLAEKAEQASAKAAKAEAREAAVEERE